MLEKLSEQELNDLKCARILYYDFFYGFFVYEIIENRASVALKQLNVLEKSPLNDACKDALNFLQTEITQNGMKNIKQEFSDLFALPFGRKQVGIHLSHYYEGCVNGESLLKIRQLVKQSDVRLDSAIFKEGEEHLGFIFGFMRHLLENDNFSALSADVFRLSSGAFSALCGEINARDDAKFYRQIAVILEAFLEVENTVLAS